MASTAVSSFVTKSCLSRPLISVRAASSYWATIMHAARTNPQYWNREDSKAQAYDASAPIIQPARILSLASPDDPANTPLHKGDLPEGAELLAVGENLEQFDVEALKAKEPNVIFVSHPHSRQPLGDLLDTFPTVQWIHTRSAGIDFVTSPTLSAATSSPERHVMVTNAKGIFSSTLAEYTMLACSYFAKDLPRLLRQKQACNWEQYPVLELRGATLGVVGYGDIGHSAAKLAKAYGMNVIALRRNPQKSSDVDGIVDVVYGNDTESLNRVFAESDYVLAAMPLTEQTKGMIGKEQFDAAAAGVQAGKKGSTVFINVGRGPVVDEPAMIEALNDGRLKGAGLDVVSIEPLPDTNPLWKMDNVLLSPHNMDMTKTFMKEATEMFVDENLPRFLRGAELLNPVDPSAGY